MLGKNSDFLTDMVLRISLLFLFGFTSLSTSLANVVGVDTQNFNPITDGLDYVTVHSSKTLEPGIINFGLFLNYAVNSLPNFEDISNQSRGDIVDTLFSTDFNLGIGLTQNWDAGISLPQMISQDVDSDVFRAEFASSGLTEVRLNTKIRVLGHPEQGGVALAASMNLNQIEDNPFAGQNPDPSYNFEFIWDKSISEASYSLNLGYRLRNPGKALPGIPLQPFKNQFIASLAASYLVQDWDTKFITEVFSSFPAEQVEFVSDRDLSSMELLVGVKVDWTHSLAFHAGAGTELWQGTGSPDWRIYTGLNWNVEPSFGSSPRESSIRRWGKPNAKSQELPKTKGLFARVEPKETETLSTEEIEREISDTENVFDGNPTGENETFVGRGVLFDFNSDQPSDSLRKILLPMVEYLRRPPGFRRLVVTGHTDSVGSEEYNLDLSRRRAETVRKALLKIGLKPSQIRAVGAGERNPIAPNTNYQGRARNRRVVFKVYRR